MCSFEGIGLHIHKSVVKYVRREIHIILKTVDTNDKNRCGADLQRFFCTEEEKESLHRRASHCHERRKRWSLGCLERK